MAVAPVKAYLDLISQPCRALLIFLKHNQIPHTVQSVALRRGEQKSAEFTRLNPMQKVPVIEHKGFVLTESDAILKYLATVCNVPEHWYPREPMRRARVDEYTAWHHTNTRLHTHKVFLSEIIMSSMLGRPADPAELQKALEELEQTLQKLDEMFLKRQAFLCGDDISIADLLAVCEIMQPLGGGRDVLKNHPNLHSWRSRVQAVLGEPFNEAHSILYRLRDKTAAKR
ncbi:glutathione S-transferase theta-1-like [Colossoma macropomum]|uniref:glutathione S-transferase theta-1-like n=1 Tax=Colossoma macropomum TaxID=42526 RepID=UPI001863BA67|nr:glutathione S-transferase theta-1-like [Colossoma macropomum]